MNTRGPGLVSAAMVAAIKADLVSLVGDADAAPATVTVSSPTGRTVNDAAGTVAITSDNDTVTCLRAEITLADVQQSAGGLQLGDIRYHVVASDLSTAPSTSSVVVDGSNRRRVVSVGSDPLGLLFTLTARRTP